MRTTLYTDKRALDIHRICIYVSISPSLSLYIYVYIWYELSTNLYKQYTKSALTKHDLHKHIICTPMDANNPYIYISIYVKLYNWFMSVTHKLFIHVVLKCNAWLAWHTNYIDNTCMLSYTTELCPWHTNYFNSTDKLSYTIELCPWHTNYLYM